VELDAKTVNKLLKKRGGRTLADNYGRKMEKNKSKTLYHISNFVSKLLSSKNIMDVKPNNVMEQIILEQLKNENPRVVMEQLNKLLEYTVGKAGVIKEEVKKTDTKIEVSFMGDEDGLTQLP
jgi:hypothetical protein